MGGQKDQPLPHRRIQQGMRARPRKAQPQRVRCRIANDKNALGRLPLGEQSSPCPISRCKMKTAHGVDRAAVELLGKGSADISRAKSRLDVHHGNALVKGAQRTDEGRGRVAVNDHGVGRKATRLQIVRNGR